MAIPFLKKKEGAAISAPVDAIKRKNDEGMEMDIDLLDAVAHDLMEALEKKDVAMIKAALEGLVEHIQDLDFQQDQADKE